MKKHLKRAVIVIVILAVIIAVVPYQCGIIVKDGGSRHWQALTWEIHRYHRLMPIELDGRGDGIFEGWRIRIFGKTVRDDYEDRYGTN